MLNHEKNEKNNQKEIRVLDSLLDLYEQNEINFPAGTKEWKKFEKINNEIALKCFLLIKQQRRNKTGVHLKIS